MMTGKVRGIECSLYNGQIREVLLFLSNQSFDFYVKWCMKIDSKYALLPNPSHNFDILPYDLKALAKESLWELILHIYPIGGNKQTIETYDDFNKSSCICCLIYYDCGLLDIYTKESNLRDQLYSLLLSLQAKEIELITDLSDGRTSLSL
jgi:hypothetical protein